jgi:hypothetical protein
MPVENFEIGVTKGNILPLAYSNLPFRVLKPTEMGLPGPALRAGFFEACGKLLKFNPL